MTRWPLLAQLLSRAARMFCGLGLWAMCLSTSWGQQPVPTPEGVWTRAQAEVQALLGSLEALVGIESGSQDLEGLDRIATWIATALQQAGMQVQILPGHVPPRSGQVQGERVGPMVLGRLQGQGQKRVLLIAHMDTVYLQGMLAKQPFRIDGDRAYGLGISDDKQGIATILHTVKMLQDLGFREYGTLTVLINADEEISSPASRALITQLGAEHDATLSFEASRAEQDKLALATAGIASVTLKVLGKASHAGGAPEQGINAIYELSHQILQMKDLSDPATGVKMNWTMARGGINRNVIPPAAEAIADVRVLRLADYDAIEAKVRERVKKQLLPDAKVSLTFERRRPPLEASPASVALGKHAQGIYKEMGMDLVVDAVAEGGGTDAAFAALKTKNAVLERFGLRGFGAHSSSDEYILISSIEPRLYLAARMVMDVSRGKPN